MATQSSETDKSLYVNLLPIKRIINNTYDHDTPEGATYNGCFFGLILCAPYLFPAQFAASFSFRVNFAPFCCDLLIRLSRELP